MNKRKLNSYRKILQSQLNELTGKADETMVQMENQRTTFPDPSDRATLESSRYRELRIREREGNLINKIQSALQRIEDGSFGTCEICGRPISEARLRARPVTTLCIDCKAEQEEMERREGK